MDFNTRHVPKDLSGGVPYMPDCAKAGFRSERIPVDAVTLAIRLHKDDPDEGAVGALPAARIRIRLSGDSALQYERTGWIGVGQSVLVPIGPGIGGALVDVLEARGNVGRLDCELSTRPIPEPRDRLWDVHSYDDSGLQTVFPVPDGAKQWQPVSSAITLTHWVYVAPGLSAAPDEVAATPGPVLATCFRTTRSGNVGPVKIAWEIEL